MESILKKLKERRGNSNLISMIFVTGIIFVLLCGCVVMFVQTSKLDNMRQIAQLMAREIALTGRVDESTNRRLQELEELYKMDVTMDVVGAYIGGTKKLRLESNFEVQISYRDKYGIGGFIKWGKETTYVRKASGIVEEYHKTS